MQRGVRDQFVGRHFSVEVLRTSFETSLRELGTDYVNMLLLHAAPVSVLEEDDLLEAMGRLIDEGKVLVAGISGELPVIAEYFEKRPRPLTTAQFALNLSSMDFATETKRNGDLLLVGNHPFGGPSGVAGARAAIARLRGVAGSPMGLSEKLDLNDAQVLPEVVLNCVLRGTGMSAVIPAMMQAKHIASNGAAVERCRFPDAELGWMRGALGAGEGVGHRRSARRRARAIIVKVGLELEPEGEDGATCHMQIVEAVKFEVRVDDAGAWISAHTEAAHGVVGVEHEGCGLVDDGGVPLDGGDAEKVQVVLDDVGVARGGILLGGVDGPVDDGGGEAEGVEFFGGDTDPVIGIG